MFKTLHITNINRNSIQGDMKHFQPHHSLSDTALSFLTKKAGRMIRTINTGQRMALKQLRCSTTKTIHLIKIC